MCKATVAFVTAIGALGAGTEVTVVLRRLSSPVSPSLCGAGTTGVHGLPLIISASMLTMEARSLMIRVLVGR